MDLWYAKLWHFRDFLFNSSQRLYCVFLRSNFAGHDCDMPDVMDVMLFRLEVTDVVPYQGGILQLAGPSAASEGAIRTCDEAARSGHGTYFWKQKRAARVVLASRATIHNQALESHREINYKKVLCRKPEEKKMWTDSIRL